LTGCNVHRVKNEKLKMKNQMPELMFAFDVLIVATKNDISSLHSLNNTSNSFKGDITAIF